MELERGNALSRPSRCRGDVNRKFFQDKTALLSGLKGHIKLPGEAALLFLLPMLQVSSWYLHFDSWFSLENLYFIFLINFWFWVSDNLGVPVTS